MIENLCVEGHIYPLTGGRFSRGVLAMASQNPENRAENPVQREVVAAFARKGLRGDSPCPVCGAQDWRINAETVAVAVVGTDGSLPDPDSAFETALLLCGACGFLRFHALSVLVGD
jgi:hypothetical protein